MTEIQYNVGNQTGKISWAASEYFGELIGQTFHLGRMEATEIDKMEGLTNVGKILLSAVAGALIQHLLDQGFEASAIFSGGEFRVLG